MRYNVEFSPYLSNKMNSPRYVIVDSESGLVLDDALGYGYKTIKKAHSSYNFLRRTPIAKARHAAKMKMALNWLMEHNEIGRRVGADIWKAVLGRADFTLDGNYIAKVLSDLNISLDDVEFTANDIATLMR